MALGKIPDKRAIQPLYDLDKKLQAIRDPANITLKKLKEAVFWAIKHCAIRGISSAKGIHATPRTPQ